MSGPLTRDEVRAALLGRRAGRPAFIPLGHRLAARVAQVDPETLREDPARLATVLDGAQRLFGYDGIVVGYDEGCLPDVVVEAARRIRAIRDDVAVLGVVPAPASPADRKEAVAMARALGEAGADAVLVHHWIGAADTADTVAALRTLARVTAFYHATIVRSVPADHPLDRAGTHGPLAPGRPLTADEDLRAPATVARVADVTGEPVPAAPEAAWLTTAGDPADAVPEDLHATVEAIGR